MDSRTYVTKFCFQNLSNCRYSAVWTHMVALSYLILTMVIKEFVLPNRDCEKYIDRALYISNSRTQMAFANG